MIQRLQTLYLIGAAICMALVLTLPLSHYMVAAEQFSLYAFGIGSAGGGDIVIKMIYVAILASLCGVLTLLDIFLFGRRMLQMRLCMGAMILSFALQLFVCYFIWYSKSLMEGFGQQVSVVFTVTAVLPVVATVLLWLAYRGIFRDEMLVRSIDRIR